MTVVFMFPGQSSRYPGMLDKLCELLPQNALLREQASDLLSWDLRAQFAAQNPDAFGRNIDVQIGVFLANQMFLNLLHAEGVTADVSLGLSLGEWNHLVHIGAVELPDALRAVRARGQAYDAGPRGWMASIQPLDYEELEPVVAELQDRGQLEIVNLNSPRQNVIAGERAAVEAAVRILEDEHYVQAAIIEKQVPMHASMFAPVAERFAQTLAGVAFAPPRRPYIPNRLGEELIDPSREQFVELLSSHVCSPVLWRQSVEHVAERWPDAVFVEVGPKKVLANLMNKKWIRMPKVHTDSPEDLRTHLRGVVAKIRDLSRKTAPSEATFAAS